VDQAAGVPANLCGAPVSPAGPTARGRLDVRIATGVGGLGAAAVLLASVALPWFRVPEGALGDDFGIVGREAPATLAFRLLCLLSVGSILWLVLRRRRRRTAAEVAAAFLAVLLFYPHAVMVWCPATAAKATALLQQHVSLSSSAGDTFVSDENKTTGWKDRVYVPELLQETAVVDTPSFSPQAVPFGHPRELLEWFGYSNAFCFFVAPGWAFAILGALLILIGLCRAPLGLDLSSAAAAGRIGASCCAVLILLCMVPAVFCAFEIERARGATEQGLLSLSLGRLELAGRILPVIRHNGDFVEQLGILESGLGMQTAEAELHRATTLQRQGQFEPAEAIFRALASDPSADDVIHREAARGLLRRGIRYLNSGEFPNAIDALGEVLRVEPTNVKANYALELAYLRSARFEALPPLAARMRDIYHYLGTLTKVPVLGINEENVAMAAFLKGDAVAAHRAWQKLSDPKRLRTEP
jgi:hypothetical protein